jgi:hypothetical protein
MQTIKHFSFLSLLSIILFSFSLSIVSAPVYANASGGGGSGASCSAATAASAAVACDSGAAAAGVAGIGAGGDGDNYYFVIVTTECDDDGVRSHRETTFPPNVGWRNEGDSKIRVKSQNRAVFATYGRNPSGCLVLVSVEEKALDVTITR